MTKLDIKKIRSDFPILKRKVNDKPLVYLDNAATSQKPNQVLKAATNYYHNSNANIHRGIHTLGDEATKAYDRARQTVADFIGANHKHEIVFTRNTTESINLVAHSWGLANLKKDDIILTTQMEHHSNIVPWQIISQQTGAKVVYIKVDPTTGTLDLKDFRSKLSSKVKLITLVHVSNFLGTINPIKKITSIINNRNSKIKTLVDGAQSVPHMPVNVKELNVDFYTFSGHKMLGPMGIGVLWGKRKILKSMNPFLTGGGMIQQVSFDKSTFAPLPDKFDAGTPNVTGAIGLAAAIDYLNQIGMQNVLSHEQALTKYALESLSKVDGLTIIGPKNHKQRGGVVAFILKGIHAHDVAQILDRKASVAVRSGHHCTMPMHTTLNLAATTRASFYIYNTKKDIDQLIAGLRQIQKIFS